MNVTPVNLIAVRTQSNFKLYISTGKPHHSHAHYYIISKQIVIFCFSYVSAKLFSGGEQNSRNHFDVSLIVVHYEIASYISSHILQKPSIL